jgi:hypothetical protein
MDTNWSAAPVGVFWNATTVVLARDVASRCGGDKGDHKVWVKCRARRAGGGPERPSCGVEAMSNYWDL